LSSYKERSEKREKDDQDVLRSYLGQRLELVHGEVREEDDHVVLHTDDQACISFVAAADHTHVIALKQQTNLDHKKVPNLLRL
jgi:hypothetical protein